MNVFVVKRVNFISEHWRSVDVILIAMLDFSFLSSTMWKYLESQYILLLIDKVLHVLYGLRPLQLCKITYIIGQHGMHPCQLLF